MDQSAGQFRLDLRSHLCGRGAARWLPNPEPMARHLRGRVGYAFDRILLYGTAGAAFGNVQTGLNPPSTFDSAVEAGWTVGAGIEVAFAQNWTAKAEYLSVDLPNATCTTAANCGGAAGSIVSFNENVIRAGINYKFGPW